jgi:hypothetical protein
VRREVMGRKKSSRRTSPGCMGRSLLAMAARPFKIIDDLGLLGFP